MSNLKAKIEQNNKLIRDVIESEVSQDDPVSLTDKLHQLVNISGLSAENMGYAIYFKESEMGKAIDGLDSKLPASILKEKLKAETAQALSLYVYTEQLDKRLSYAIDAIRTAISLFKTELENGSN